MMKKPTIKEIANIVGVSTTTISRYLNGKYENMSQETKDRIKEVIEELDYEPSSIARNLKTNKSGIIGLIVSDIMKSSFPILAKGINDVCIEEGFQLMIANSDNDKFNEKKHLKAMSEYNFEGIVINQAGKNLDYLLDLKNEGTNLVLADQGIDNRTIDSVTLNNREITQMVIKSLFNNGYEDVYYVGDKITSNSVRNDKYWGFKLGCQEYLDNYEAKLIIFDNNDSDFDDKFKYIYDNYNKKKIAIFCENGIILLQTLKYLKRMNIRIPEDIGILGFDDLEWSDTLEEGISVIKQPIYKVGREAAKLLIDRINGESNVNETMHLILKNTYIERNSTKIIK